MTPNNLKIYKQFAGFGNPAMRLTWRATRPVLNMACSLVLSIANEGNCLDKNFWPKLKENENPQNYDMGKKALILQLTQCVF